MIPIRKKKKTLKVTVDEMRNFAFNYIEKYAPSKQQLKTYLLKKYLKTSALNLKKQDVTNLIDIVLSDLEKSKFINDKFYSESKAKSMIQRGNSINKIRSYLIGKGINDAQNIQFREALKECLTGLQQVVQREIRKGGVNIPKRIERGIKRQYNELDKRMKNTLKEPQIEHWTNYLEGLKVVMREQAANR